ncbi:MAG: gamma-glutamyltransferase [Desulfobulbus propionicus]|nr:MAG: gamma-glutamyltransferase [Desulfobulbus propionicus]
MSCFSRSIVASGHQLVSEAAAEVLRGGGNAFDAAVAAGFAGAVAEPCLTSLGGGGFLLARTAGARQSGQEVFFDFFVDTPGKGLARQPKPHFFPVTVKFGGSDQDFNIGLGSVAVPGTLKGLLHVHQRLGYMDLKDVLHPAMKLAKGHVVSDFQGVFMQLLYPIMTLTETGRALYEPGGKYLTAGDILVNPQMAAFLESLAGDGGACFYSGHIAEAIVRDMEEGNGLITAEDLAGYQVIERKPLKVAYGKHTFFTSPPPSFGGLLIGLSLGLNNQLRGEHTLGTPGYFLQSTAIMQEVEQLREQEWEQPEVLTTFMTSEQLHQAVNTVRLFSRGTTHVSVADRHGNVASMTCSNGEGSGYFAPETGIMLNNMMGEDDLHPKGFHSSPPGQRVGSMMSPSMLVDKTGQVKLVIGSGGSKRIRTAIIQVLTRIIDHNQSIQEAVDAPRLHWDGEVLQIEPGVSDEVVAAIKNKVPVNCWEEQSVYFGGVHTVIPGEDGAGDPRRGGKAIVVEG